MQVFVSDAEEELLTQMLRDGPSSAGWILMLPHLFSSLQELHMANPVGLTLKARGPRSGAGLRFFWPKLSEDQCLRRIFRGLAMSLDG